MPPFSSFSDPFSSRSVHEMMSVPPALPDGDRIIRALNAPDFDLLVRAVELVIQANAFSRNGIQAALQLANARADRLTKVLELLEIVTPGGDDEQRHVLVGLDQLTNTLFRLYEFRDAATGMLNAA